MSWGDWFKHNADKVLLFCLVLIMYTGVITMSARGMEAAMITWGREITGTVVGALLTLITGALLRRPPVDPEPPVVIERSNRTYVDVDADRKPPVVTDKK